VCATVPVNAALDVSAARACITTRPGGLFFSDAPWRPLWIPDARHRYAWHCCVVAWWAGLGAAGLSSDGEGEFDESFRDPVARVDVDGEFVVAAVKVLDEGVSGANHSGGAQPFESAHRPQSGFQAAVICFDGVVYCSIT
jgi:hypothetical protein